MGKNWCRPSGVFVVTLSFAPSGLALLARLTHGLRRGLHSFAASRLGGRFVRPWVVEIGFDSLNRSGGAGLGTVNPLMLAFELG